MARSFLGSFSSAAFCASSLQSRRPLSPTVRPLSVAQVLMRVYDFITCRLIKKTAFPVKLCKLRLFVFDARHFNFGYPTLFQARLFLKREDRTPGVAVSTRLRPDCLAR